MTPKGFWNKVDVKGPDDCWNWLAHTCNGYGHVRCGDKIKKAHRIAFEDCHGHIPSGKVLMHKCDNRKCVNPAHLVVGTAGENNKDRDLKGRHIALRGEAHGMARLNERAVKRIKQLQARQAEERSRLAEKLGVDIVTLNDVIRGKTWKAVL